MIKFENICMSYGANEILKNLNLEIKEGELAVLIGPSGCGKTTSLQLINRLINPTSGHVFIDGKDIQTINPVSLRRTMGYVIQEIGLFPHMTIEQNIEIVPKLLKWTEEKRKKRTIELLEMVDMSPDTYLKRYPSDLSGGQKQRIGLLRALAVEPPIVLMDEPFGALDPITRDALQDEIKRLQKKLKKTIVFVTHDMDEAIKIADRIVLMKEGQIVQAASPDEMLSDPADEFVEQFIGKHRLYNGNVNKVRDVMRTDPFMAPSSLGLPKCVAMMRKKQVSGCLVTDDDEKLLGYIGIEEIIDKARTGMRISDLNVRPLPKMHYEDSAVEAFDMIVRDKLDIVAVVDDEDRVKGAVTKTSMVTAFARIVWKEGTHD